MEQKGDFLGFKFAGKHSSTLNIIRVSGGDRFDEQVIPDIKNTTVEVPGMDGEYFFGSTYGPRTFEISIAYDHLTESDFRQLRKIYGRKQIGELIFDERPYKKYLVKIESPIELSYICFDEPKYDWKKIQVGTEEVIDTSGDVITQPVYYKGIQGNDYEYKEYDGTTQRIYKGEGKITFIAYFPFAKSCFKVLDTNERKESDWAISSGILKDIDYVDVDKYKNGQIIVYNAGDVSTGFRLYVPFVDNGTEKTTQAITLTYQHSSNSNPYQTILSLNNFKAKQCGSDANDNPIYDIGFLIDTNTGLITGVQPQTATTGNIIYDPETYELIEVSQDTIETGIMYDQDGNAQYITTGNLYNEYIESGYFFKLEPDDIYDKSDLNHNSKIIIENGVQGIEIFYDYLYF